MGGIKNGQQSFSWSHVLWFFLVNLHQQLLNGRFPDLRSNVENAIKLCVVRSHSIFEGGFNFNEFWFYRDNAPFSLFPTHLAVINWDRK